MFSELFNSSSLSKQGKVAVLLGSPAAPATINKKKRKQQDISTTTIVQKSYIPACLPRIPLANPAAPIRSRNVYPFQVYDGDHCETPKTALSHIVFILDIIAASIGKNRQALQIYDPFYCDGAIKQSWLSLGFPHCYNENEDFYSRLRDGCVPAHDVVVTNPPYSGQHLKNVVEISFSNEKPFLLLLPNFVYKKLYYTNCMKEVSPLYVVPKKAYSYCSPGTLEQTTPFFTFWFVGLSSDLRKRVLSAKFDGNVYVAGDESKIPTHAVPVRQDQMGQPLKRPNPRSRKKRKLAIIHSNKL